MGKTLYLECAAGISGDMTVGALLDLGADEKVLRGVLGSIPQEGFRIEIGRVKKAGVDCCDFRVVLDEAHENHDHDMDYLHGPGDTQPHEKQHGHTHEEHGHIREEHRQHGHVHEPSCGQTDEPHAHHHHTHRGMAEIREILAACHMTERAREIAGRIFSILACAEAKAHKVPVEEVHFHEVGAIDSIVDIVAAAVCLDNLDITKVIVPSLREGRGMVRCQHGVLPIPVPAVANIMAEYGLRVELTDVEGEFVTPTGAAIVAAIRTSDRLPREMQITKIGMGAGKRTYERPSILRAMLICQKEGPQVPDIQRDTIYKLESNIDDSTGETLGYVMERLLEAGARDVHYTPVYMKKNRPAWQLNVICGWDDIERLERIIFSETTTIGIRRVEMERSVLQRRQLQIETSYGKALVKVCESGAGRRYYPEYDSIVTICARSGLTYRQAYQHLAALAERAEKEATGI